MMTKLCKCGCGTEILAKDRWGNRPSFVNGHQNRKLIKLKVCECGCGQVLPRAKTDKPFKYDKKRYIKGHFNKGHTPNRGSFGYGRSSKGQISPNKGKIDIGKRLLASIMLANPPFCLLKRTLMNSFTILLSILEWPRNQMPQTSSTMS